MSEDDRQLNAISPAADSPNANAPVQTNGNEPRQLCSVTFSRSPDGAVAVLTPFSLILLQELTAKCSPELK